MESRSQSRIAALIPMAGILILGVLLSGVLAGCRSTPIVPYAFKPTDADPRLLVRVPAGTPGSTLVPLRERLHKSCWARRCGEVETPDPRWACCPEDTESEEWKRNEVTCLLAYTGVRAGDGGTLGLGYERRFNRTLGVLIFGEYVFGESQVPVVGAGLTLHVTRELTLLLGGGVEFEDGEGEPLARLGASYAVYSRNNIRIAPVVYMDLVEGREAVLILGLEFGREF